MAGCDSLLLLLRTSSKQTKSQNRTVPLGMVCGTLGNACLYSGNRKHSVAGLHFGRSMRQKYLKSQEGLAKVRPGRCHTQLGLRCILFGIIASQDKCSLSAVLILRCIYGCIIMSLSVRFRLQTFPPITYYCNHCHPQTLPENLNG